MARLRTVLLLSLLAPAFVLLLWLVSDQHPTLAAEQRPEGMSGPAGRLVSLAGLDRGLCAVIGCEDPALPLALAHGTQFIIHVQSPNATLIDRLRARLANEGLYGKRVTAEVGALGPLPYADSSIDLVACSSLSEKSLAEASVEEVTRVLRPGGVAILGARTGLGAPALRRWADTADATREMVEDDSGVWAKLVKKPSPLTDDWTHWQHAPDNNPVSTDAVIKAPYMTQFLSLPYYSPMPSISVICNGIQFRAAGHMAIHEREERLVNTLYASSAHNGIVLWTRPLPEGYLVHRSLFVAQPDVLYLIEPTRCLLLDPETGAERDAIPLPEGLGEGAQWQWIALDGAVSFGKNETVPSTQCVNRS